jgi:hypothetical protein
LAGVLFLVVNQHISKENCKSTYFKGNKKENEVTLFAIPKTSLSKWRELIPCSNLTSTSHICSQPNPTCSILSNVGFLTLEQCPGNQQFLLNGSNIVCSVQSVMHRNRTIFILDTSSQQVMQNVDVFKWRNNVSGIFTYVYFV